MAVRLAAGWQFGQHPGQQDGPPPPLQLWWGQAPRPAADVAPAAPTTPIRIGDAERDKAVSDLGEHFAAGRLDREEFDDRADQAMQARFSTDLTRCSPICRRRAGGTHRRRPGRPAGGPPPWAYAMWLLPVLLIAAVVGGIFFHAPFLLWAVIWMVVILKITGHKRRHRREQLASRPGPR